MKQILLILPVIIVLITELVNSAIETAVDSIRSDFHEFSDKVKYRFRRRFYRTAFCASDLEIMTF